MKIAIVTSGGLPVPNVKGGGAQTLITAILDQNEIQGKHEFVVYSSYDENAESVAKKYKKSEFVFLENTDRTLMDRVRGRITKNYPLESPISFTTIAKSIAKKRCDKVIVEHTPGQFPFFVKKFGTKTYCHLHNDWLKSESEKNYIKRMRKAINKSGGMITVSDYIKECVLSIGGVEEEKVNILYNATNVGLFSQKASSVEKESIKARLSIPEDSIVILYSGRMCQDKGVHELIEAFIQVSKKKKNIVLLLVGSVSYGETTNDDYTKKIKEYMIQYNNIIETGFVEYKDMHKYYSIADIQVIPSKWEEPFGLVAIEGMAQGLPIISTNSGGLVEILDHNCAMIIDKENEIKELESTMLYLVNNEKERIKLGQRARKKLEQHKEYTYEEYYNKFLEIIE